MIDNYAYRQFNSTLCNDHGDQVIKTMLLYINIFCSVNSYVARSWMR